MWRGGFPPGAAAPRVPPPAIEFPEESPEPRFDGKRGWVQQSSLVFRGERGEQGSPPLSAGDGWVPSSPRLGMQGRTSAFLFTHRLEEPAAAGMMQERAGPW